MLELVAKEIHTEKYVHLVLRQHAKTACVCTADDFNYNETMHKFSVAN